jgi:EAL domain-containing protein (putative c-di-GMP-specific phosphodiesterase class I)
VRETDTISRQGGDEFLVILPQIPHADDAGQVAHKIITTLAEPFELNGTEMSITSSVGIAIYPDDGDSLPVLMRNADTAMYRAKSMGRNTFCYYQAEMNASSMEILRMEGLLRHVVERKELLLHYQPQVELVSGIIRGVEALLRWNSPELGLVPPVRFIPLAEETGLITPIGEWVLREACRWARQMHDAGHAELRLAVNLSARQFSDQGLVDMVADALASSGLPAKFLELELTESALMHNLEAGQLTLARLKALGIELAVDDFGTGYSSLAYLQRFPIDRLKIDRSFITGVARKPEDETIARAIIVLAHALGLEVVAEGVEDEAQYQVLKDLGCDLIQGYYISRPVPGEQIPALLKR